MVGAGVGVRADRGGSARESTGAYGHAVDVVVGQGVLAAEEGGWVGRQWVRGRGPHDGALWESSTAVTHCRRVISAAAFSIRAMMPPSNAAFAWWAEGGSGVARGTGGTRRGGARRGEA